jgi:hypothetical protein
LEKNFCFCGAYKKDYDLFHKFEATGSVLDAARSGRPRSVNMGEARVGLKEVLQRSPQKSSRRLSPYLTPPDFFLWGVVIDIVYANKPRTVEDLKREIRAAVGGIPLELCAKVCRSVPSRLQKCLDVGGAQTELF